MLPLFLKAPDFLFLLPPNEAQAAAAGGGSGAVLPCHKSAAMSQRHFCSALLVAVALGEDDAILWIVFSLQQAKQNCFKRDKIYVGLCVSTSTRKRQEALNQKVATSPGSYCMFPVFL